MKNKFATTMMISLVIISSTLFNINAYAITVETDKDHFEPGETVVVSGTANATSEILLSMLFNETYVIHDDNFTSLEDGNYSTTLVLSNDAEPGVYNVTVTSGAESDFVLFIVELENETIPEPEEPGNVTFTESLGDGEGLANAILRAESYLEKLNGLIEALRTEYEGIEEVLVRLDDIDAKLSIAEGYLVSAETAVGSNHKDAVRYYSAARNLMGRIKGMLDSLFKMHKTERIEKFSSAVENRIDSLVSKIDVLDDRLANGQEVKLAMNLTKFKLGQIMKSLKAGNTSTAMEYLGVITDEIDDNIDNLNGTETAAQFKDLYKLEARVRALEKKALKLQRKGIDATEVLDSISLAQSQLGQLNSYIERGNKNKQGTSGVGLGHIGGVSNSGPKNGIRGYMKPKKNGK